jgi:hypothetical protein
MPDLKTRDLLESGLALIKIPLGTKGPTTIGWNRREKAITDPSQFVSLRGMNMGLAHAYCTPSPTCALDVDNYQAALPWLAVHDVDLLALLTANDAVVIWSGKKNSIKLLYRLPVSTAPLESKKIVGSDGLSALEFRCAAKDGKTVQDVLPPSRHPDGHDYKWMGYGNPLLMPVIPDKLLAVWLQLISNTSRVALRRSQTAVINHQRQETPREVATIRSALNHISAACEYEKWRNVVWAILSTGWLCAEDLAFDWSKTAPDRFDDDAFWLVANSFIPNHSTQITVGTVYHHARLGGWNG